MNARKNVKLNYLSASKIAIYATSCVRIYLKRNLRLHVCLDECQNHMPEHMSDLVSEQYVRIRKISKVRVCQNTSEDVCGC